MRLVTWNVNSIKARLPRVLEMLEAHAPDIAFLQELKCAEEGFPHLDLLAAGYESATHCGGRWAGVAVLARSDGPRISRVGCGLDGEARPDEARWVEATVGDLRVASVYVPNGRAVGTEEFADKLAFLDATAARMAAPDPPAVIAGDLNVTRTDADVWDAQAAHGSTHVTPEERERLEAILRAGLVDGFRAHEPDRRQFTWWDYRAGAFHRDLGMRLDYLLLAPRLAERLRWCGIDRELRKGPKPSDHAPLIAELG